MNILEGKYMDIDRIEVIGCIVLLLDSSLETIAEIVFKDEDNAQACASLLCSLIATGFITQIN